MFLLNYPFWYPNNEYKRMWHTLTPFDYKTTIILYNSQNALSINVVGIQSKKENTQSLNVQHKKFGHVHHNMIKQMETKDMVDGLVISGSKEDPPFGVGCVYGKSRKMFFSWKEH
jgi:hypothetical protein